MKRLTPGMNQPIDHVKPVLGSTNNHRTTVTTKKMWIRGRTLGCGSAGIVSLALFRDTQTSRLIAVKSAKISSAISLHRERRLLGLFKDCSNIILCHGADITEENGVVLYNLLLEYASFGSLFDRIQSTRDGLPIDEVRAHTKSTLMGLHYIHQRGYVHCDIKPHNILLVGPSSNSRLVKKTDVTAKIADFGLALKVGESGTLLRGTILYMAPESICYQHYVSQSDIWALGCTVLEMVTGKPVWDDNKGWKSDTSTLLFRIAYTKEVPDIPSGLSNGLKDFLSKCFFKDPRQRWSADMLLNHPFITRG